MMSDVAASPTARLSGRADPIVPLAGVRITNLTMAQALGRIERMIRLREPSYVVTPNVDHVVRYQRRDDFTTAYDNAALVLADGMPLLWAGKFLKTPIKQKVSGSDLFPLFCEIAAEKGYKLFFLGGKPGAAQRSAEILTARNPGLKVVGVYCPPMGFEQDPVEHHRTIEMIKASGADLLFVGLGTPKQEVWISKNYRELNVPVSIGIGASFDFIAGLQKRAPVVMQKLGFEWLWRLVLDPKRMYKRYLVDDPEFFLLIWRQREARNRALGRALQNAPDSIYTDIYTEPEIGDDGTNPTGGPASAGPSLTDEDINAVSAQAQDDVQKFQKDHPAPAPS